MPLSPYAEAWQKWKVQNEKSFDPTTIKAPEDQRQFLENRLHRAYTEGLIAGAAIARDEVMDKVREFLLKGI